MKVYAVIEDDCSGFALPLGIYTTEAAAKAVCVVLNKDCSPNGCGRHEVFTYELEE